MVRMIGEPEGVVIWNNGSPMSERVAVCVDGENIASSHAERIRAIAGTHGSPDTLRVYGNASAISGWHDAVGYKIVHSGVGKNATDILMTVDAMELALREGYQTLLIVSSDGDFTLLAMRLRELGISAIGIGEAKAPAAFRGACADFKELMAPCRTSPSKKPQQSEGGPSVLDHKIRGVIAGNSTNGQGMRIAELAPKMHSKFGTRISTYPERTWRGYLNARRKLYELDPKGPNAKVRFLQNGFDASS